MKVLILGGTGAMGKHLVDLLSEERIDVHVTTRSNRNDEESIHYIIGDAHDDIFISNLLEKSWDVIVDFMSYTTEEFSNRVKKLLNSTKQYIFLSSSRVYADSQTAINESSARLLDICKDEKYLQTDEYALSKARQENVLKNSLKNNWTIIRPYITYSETRLQLGVLEKEYWLYRALHGRTIVFSKDIASRTTTLTYGYDVACGIKSIIGKEEAIGQIFHITSEKSLTWNEVYDVYQTVFINTLGYKPNIVYSHLQPFLTCHPFKYQVIYDRLFDRVFDNNKITNYIDVSKFVEPTEGLKKCLETFFRNPSFSELDWGLEAKKDKVTHEFTSLQEIPCWKQKIKYLIYRFI